MPDDTQLIEEARERFQSAKEAWSDVRRAASEDLRMVSGDQWDPEIKAARDDAGRPALTFNRLHTLVQQITNQARQERPQPKVNPVGDGASVATAEVFEGLMRHIQYASQADVAYDNAVEYSAACGFGYYRITTEYVDDESFDQEPRIRRILDPMTVYFDPDCQEPDFSDAKFCFVRQRMKREEYEERFGDDASSFDAGDEGMEDWADDEHVWIAEYWHVECKTRQLLQLVDGTKGYREELEQTYGPLEPEHIANQRDVDERTVHFDLIDGAKSLEKTTWLGKWISIIPVLGKECVIDGKRQLISLIRFALDAQKLLNGYKSGVAESIGLSTRAPWIGVKGQFKDAKWKNPTKNHAYLEYEPVSINGQPAAPPTRNVFEAPISSLSAGALQEADDIKQAAGYNDSVLQPSKSADLSGVAVMRRTNQADLTNFHFEDNLARSQWHAARILLDLIPKVIDTARAVRILSEDGSVSMAAITLALPDGTVPLIQGMEHVPHHRLDVGRYDVTISIGPSYATKREEERDALMEMGKSNPVAWQLYGDLIFKAMGYSDLEERAKLGLAPQIQAAIAQKNGQGQQGPPPQMLMAQIQQLSQQNQMLSMKLKEILLEQKAKLIEGETRIKVEMLKAHAAMGVESMKQKHEGDLALFDGQMQAIQKMLDMLHESTMWEPKSENAPQQQPAQAA